MINPFRAYVGMYAAVAGMDDAGEIILGTYLNGDGSPVIVRDDPFWTAYMMKHSGLRAQIFRQLTDPVAKLVSDLDCRKDGRSRFPISKRFHAEFEENGNRTGYALMHGSNGDVGDFLIVGWAEPTQPAPDG